MNSCFPSRMPQLLDTHFQRNSTDALGLHWTVHRPRQSTSANRSTTRVITSSLLTLLVLVCFSGCQDDMATVRKIQSARQTRMQTETKVDHLGEAMNLASRWIELDATTASRQVVYHLNAWQTAQNATSANSKPDAAQSSIGQVPQLVRTISELIPPDEADKLVTQTNFVPLDVYYLRYVYLLKKLSDWVRDSGPTDPLWQTWLTAQAKEKGDDHAQSLAVSIKLFDWVVRNVSLEPMELTDPAPPVPPCRWE